MRTLSIQECNISGGSDATPLAIFSTVNLGSTIFGAATGAFYSAGQAIAIQQPYYMLANIGLGGILGSFMGTIIGTTAVIGYFHQYNS